MVGDQLQPDKLIATISVANSKSCYRVQLKFKELCLQSEILDHIAAAINACADTLHDFGFKEKAYQARGGVEGVEQFKETLIQEHLGLPGSRFGVPPREGAREDEEHEDIEALQEENPPDFTPVMKPEFLQGLDTSPASASTDGAVSVREDSDRLERPSRSDDSHDSAAAQCEPPQLKSSSRMAFLRFLSARLKAPQERRELQSPGDKAYPEDFENLIQPADIRKPVAPRIPRHSQRSPPRSHPPVPAGGPSPPVAAAASGSSWMPLRASRWNVPHTLGSSAGR